eukprot:TRINITY_DN10784_c0_g1_i6.p1 TRINITY_DN10784_c0_g1~~TRINITY_DN10784_c0_g1_i6.p1  ORF type:complete len:202 (-),score=10.97 TRINITY_DN10784_c0_g1_i6:408-1013(-)
MLTEPRALLKESRDPRGEDALPGIEFTGTVSLKSSLSNLVLAVLGAGQLTLPYALSQLGFAFGLIALVGFSLLSVHSLYALSTSTLYLSARSASRIDTYCKVVRSVFGKAGYWLVIFLVVAYAWGGAVSFMIILKGEFGFLQSLLLPPDRRAPAGCLLATVSILFTWPMSSRSEVSALKRTAPLGCIAAVLITGVVLPRIT